MRIFNLVLTYLVAAVFLILGVVAYFYPLFPMPKMEGLQLQFFSVMGPTKYLFVVKMFELVGGLMLALNFRRALGWAILLPIIVNITLYEFLIARQPGMGLILLAIDLYMILYVHRNKFRALWEK